MQLGLHVEVEDLSQVPSVVEVHQVSALVLRDQDSPRRTHRILHSEVNHLVLRHDIVVREHLHDVHAVLQILGIGLALTQHLRRVGVNRHLEVVNVALLLDAVVAPVVRVVHERALTPIGGCEEILDADVGALLAEVNTVDVVVLGLGCHLDRAEDVSLEVILALERHSDRLGVLGAQHRLAADEGVHSARVDQGVGDVERSRRILTNEIILNPVEDVVELDLEIRVVKSLLGEFLSHLVTVDDDGHRLQLVALERLAVGAKDSTEQPA